MLVNKTRMYPYPILWEENDDYTDSRFSVDYNGYSKAGDSIVFDIDVDLKNNGIENLIKNSDAKMIIHMEDSKTKFRKIFELRNGNNALKIKSSELNGEVQLLPLIVTTRSIEYKNNQFSDFFKGCTFNMPAGSIISIGSQYKEVIDKETNDLMKLSSIVSVIRHEDAKEKAMEVECSRKEKIYVKLPEKAYIDYLSICKRKDYQSIIFSIFIVPAITYALQYIKDNIDDDTAFLEFNDFRWFRVLSSKIKEKYKSDFDLDFIRSMDALEIAQKIIDNPISDAVASLSGGE